MMLPETEKVLIFKNAKYGCLQLAETCKEIRQFVHDNASLKAQGVFFLSVLHCYNAASTLYPDEKRSILSRIIQFLPSPQFERALACIEGIVKKTPLFMINNDHSLVTFANSLIFIDAEKALGIARGIKDFMLKVTTMRDLGKVIASTDGKRALKVFNELIEFSPSDLRENVIKLVAPDIAPLDPEKSLELAGVLKDRGIIYARIAKALTRISPKWALVALDKALEADKDIYYISKDAILKKVVKAIKENHFEKALETAKKISFLRYKTLASLALTESNENKEKVLLVIRQEIKDANFRKEKFVLAEIAEAMAPIDPKIALDAFEKAFIIAATSHPRLVTKDNKAYVVYNETSTFMAIARSVATIAPKKALAAALCVDESRDLAQLLNDIMNKMPTMRENKELATEMMRLCLELAVETEDEYILGIYQRMIPRFSCFYPQRALKMADSIKGNSEKRQILANIAKELAPINPKISMMAANLAIKGEELKNMESWDFEHIAKTLAGVYPDIALEAVGLIDENTKNISWTLDEMVESIASVDLRKAFEVGYSIKGASHRARAFERLLKISSMKL